MYEELVEDDELNYKEPEDFLAKARASIATVSAITNKGAKAEQEASSEES